MRAHYLFIMLAMLVLAAGVPARAADKAEAAKQIAVLQDTAATVTAKDEAIRALTRLGAPEAVPALAALLNDEHLSTLARGALEAIPAPEAGAALRKALGELKGRPLIGVIASLGNRHDAEAIGDLTKLLAGAQTEDDVAAAAAGALAKIGGPDASKLLTAALKTGPAERKRAAIADACLRLAGSLHQQGKADEALALYNTVREAGVPEYIVRAATLGMVRVDGAKSVGMITNTLKSDDWAQFSLGLQASRLVPEKAMTEALCAVLRESKPDKQVLILKALADRNDPSILAPVLEMARQGDPAARAEALHVVGRIGDTKVLPDLFTLAGDPQAPVADAAKAVLTGLAGAEVDKAVMDRIQAQDAATRLLALELAGKRAIKTAGAELLKLAADPDRQVRQAALRALGDGGGAGELTALLDMMAKAQPGELNGLEGAVRSIASRQEPQAAAKEILGRLPSAQGPQKASLLKLAGAQGTPETLKAVQAALKDSDPKVADAAFRTLCDWPNAEAAPELLALAKAPGKGTRPVLALRAYIRLAGAKAVPAGQKVQMLRQAAPLAKGNAEKKQMLGVMQTVPNPAVLAMAAGHLDNAEICNEAAQAALAITEKLAGARQPNTAANDALVQAMKKIIEVSDNADAKRRAQTILDRLAGGKK